MLAIESTNVPSNLPSNRSASAATTTIGRGTARTLGVLATLAALALGTGCTSEGDGGGSGGGSGGASSDGEDRSDGDRDGDGDSEEIEFACCINGEGYSCPNQKALDRCGGGPTTDMGACMDACAPGDFDCQDDCLGGLDLADPDPSDCEPAPAACKPQGGGGECAADSEQCEVSIDCCGAGRCVDGYCEGAECVAEFGTCGSDLDCCGTDMVCYAPSGDGDGYCSSDVDSDACMDDSDCPAGNTCFAGSCTTPEEGACQSDYDCPGIDEVCISGVCQ